MDHRCPHCNRDLTARRLSQPIIARLEVDCRYCKRRIKVNVHRAEEVLIFATLAGFLLCAGLGYALDRQGLYAVAFGVAMAGAGALPLAERVWLRTWRRYVPIEAPAVPEFPHER
ncbi:MAG TPA: hypothetical protein VHG88_15835 [Burkholderiales bacterium]|nr:hypothetical protein [Burkholderiales bacterium]